MFTGNTSNMYILTSGRVGVVVRCVCVVGVVLYPVPSAQPQEEARAAAKQRGLLILINREQGMNI